MQGKEIALYDMGVKAVIAAVLGIAEATPEELLKKIIYGKSDTLGMDANPEILLRQAIGYYDKKNIFVTEEQEPGLNEWPKSTDSNSDDVVFISDPVDRSKYMEKFFRLVSAGKEKQSVFEIMKEINSKKIWEESIGDKPVTITGATTALSCLVGGKILYSVIANHISSSITIAGPNGVYQMELPSTIEKVKKVDLAYIQKNGKRLIFPSANESCLDKREKMRFVAFNGKSGYPENLVDSMIIVDDPNSYIHHNEPGGPSRVLYLSELQKGNGPVGFIVANGEKITEWIHWLAFVKYAENTDGNPALMIYEVSNERPHTKGGIPMSTHPSNSIFYKRDGENFIDVSLLRRFDPPSHFRSMLVISPWDNDFILVAMTKNNYREVSDCL